MEGKAGKCEGVVEGGSLEGGEVGPMRALEQFEQFAFFAKCRAVEKLQTYAIMLHIVQSSSM